MPSLPASLINRTVSSPSLTRRPAIVTLAPSFAIAIAVARPIPSLSTGILGLRNSIYTNNEIIRKQNVQLRSLDRKLGQLQLMLRNTSKDSNYHQVAKIVDQRLNDKRSLLVTALLAVFKTLKTNP